MVNNTRGSYPEDQEHVRLDAMESGQFDTLIELQGTTPGSEQLQQYQSNQRLLCEGTEIELDQIQDPCAVGRPKNAGVHSG